MNTPYHVEAWDRRINCVGFSTPAKATTAVRRALDFVAFKNASRVYVRKDGETVATWDNGGWQSIKDARIRAAVEAM